MIKQTNPPQATEEEIHQALVECLQIAARRGRQLRLEREGKLAPNGGIKETSDKPDSDAVDMSHEEFLVWADEQRSFIAEIRTFRQNFWQHQALIKRFNQIEDQLTPPEIERVMDILHKKTGKDEAGQIDEIIRGCEWFKKVEEGKKILAQLENLKSQSPST